MFSFRYERVPRHEAVIVALALHFERVDVCFCCEPWRGISVELAL
jgi:hypothetical protein